MADVEARGDQCFAVPARAALALTPPEVRTSKDVEGFGLDEIVARGFALARASAR